MLALICSNVSAKMFTFILFSAFNYCSYFSLWGEGSCLSWGAWSCMGVHYVCTRHSSGVQWFRIWAISFWVIALCESKKTPVEDKAQLISMSAWIWEGALPPPSSSPSRRLFSNVSVHRFSMFCERLNSTQPARLHLRSSTFPSSFGRRRVA